MRPAGPARERPIRPAVRDDVEQLGDLVGVELSGDGVRADGRPVARSGVVSAGQDCEQREIALDPTAPAFICSSGTGRGRSPPALLVRDGAAADG